jgi:hypothetical protein
MRFVQGTILKNAKGGDGYRRLLLSRSDGSEFVALVKEKTKINGVGQHFRAGGFVEQEPFKDRKVYKQIEATDVVSTVVDFTDKPKHNNQGIEISTPTKMLTDVQRASIELSAIINLTSQLLEQPVEQVIEDINKIYKSI